jgi:predicted nucleic acid-binding Zn ribbon protein
MKASKLLSMCIPCSVCGKAFVSNTTPITKVCSPECKRLRRLKTQKKYKKSPKGKYESIIY